MDEVDTSENFFPNAEKTFFVGLFSVFFEDGWMDRTILNVNNYQYPIE
jgi:hypothetical protein